MCDSKTYTMSLTLAIVAMTFGLCFADSPSNSDAPAITSSSMSLIPAPPPMYWQRYPARAVFVVAPGESIASLSTSHLAEQQNSLLNQLDSLPFNFNPSTSYKNAPFLQLGNGELNGDRASVDSDSKLFSRLFSYDPSELIKMRNQGPRKRTIIRGAWGPGNKHIPLEDLFNCLQMANYGRKDPSNCYDIIKRTH
jgi:hypothetical protein